MIDIQELLGRLTKVKQTGQGEWIASSPVRRDSSPSLYIKLTHDQKILMHDFGGAGIDKICEALGIGVEDLFPDNLSVNYDKKIRYPFSTNIMKALKTEMMIITLCGLHIIRGKELSREDMDRVVLAVQRMKEGYELCLK